MNAGPSQTSVSRNTQLKECENQAKFVQQRVNEIETFFGDLCAELVSYTRRTAKLRNNGDEIARILLDYSVREKINRSTSCSLKKLSEHLATLEDYRHTEVDRLVGKVVNPLASYGNEIKTIRFNLKTENAARKRELNNRRKLERSNTAEASRLAQIQLHNAILDANKSADKLERCIVEFEARRLKGLKNILKDFIQIEMIWHAKALETLGEAFNALETLHEETDLIDFRSTLMRSGQSVASLNQPTGRTVQSNFQAQSGDIRPQHSMRANVSGARGAQAVTLNSGDAKSNAQHTEDGVSLFTEDEEDDELSEDVAATAAAGPAARRMSGKTDVLQDLDDDDDDDDEEEEEDEDEDDDDEDSELTQTAPTTASSRRVRVQNKGSTGKLQSTPTAQSPLKSALKTGSTIK